MVHYCWKLLDKKSVTKMDAIKDSVTFYTLVHPCPVHWVVTEVCCEWCMLIDILVMLIRILSMLGSILVIMLRILIMLIRLLVMLIPIVVTMIRILVMLIRILVIIIRILVMLVRIQVMMIIHLFVVLVSEIKSMI